MIVHNINPVILDLPGPFEIRWYGLMYVLGFLFTYYYAKRQINKGKLNITVKQLDTFLGAAILAMILGARLFYTIFYNPSYFLASPLDFFAVWKGGLSFHGGLVGIIIVAAWFVRKHKIDFLKFADVLIVPIVLANALGRFGNFVNGEIYGIVSSLPWAVVFPLVEGARHPTQLYAVFYNVVIFFTLLLTKDKFRENGRVFGVFLVMYSVFRFINEFFKDLPVYGLKTGQWLTIPLLFIGLWLLFRKGLKTSEKKE